MSFAQWMLEMSCKKLLLMGCYCKRGFCNTVMLSRSLTPEGGSGLKVHEPQVVSAQLPATSCCLSHMDTVQHCVTASEQVHVRFFFFFSSSTSHCLAEVVVSLLADVGTVCGWIFLSTIFAPNAGNLTVNYHMDIVTAPGGLWCAIQCCYFLC